MEQIALNEETIGDALKFVKENEMVKVCSYNGNVFAIEPPLFVELGKTGPGCFRQPLSAIFQTNILFI